MGISKVIINYLLSSLVIICCIGYSTVNFNIEFVFDNPVHV